MEGALDAKDMMKELIAQLGSRIGVLGYQITMLSTSGQPCDVTFFHREPAINVKIDQKVTLALMYGAGAEKLKQLLENIRLSNGMTVSLAEIWTINPMPAAGFSQEELAAVDLAEAEEPTGPNGETLRKMISDTYHCKNKDEEDYYLRRFIAS